MHQIDCNRQTQQSDELFKLIVIKLAWSKINLNKKNGITKLDSLFYCARVREIKGGRNNDWRWWNSFDVSTFISHMKTKTNVLYSYYFIECCSIGFDGLKLCKTAINRKSVDILIRIVCVWVCIAHVFAVQTQAMERDGTERSDMNNALAHICISLSLWIEYPLLMFTNIWRLLSYKRVQNKHPNAIIQPNQNTIIRKGKKKQSVRLFIVNRWVDKWLFVHSLLAKRLEIIVQIIPMDKIRRFVPMHWNQLK